VCPTFDSPRRLDPRRNTQAVARQPRSVVRSDAAEQLDGRSCETLRAEWLHYFTFGCTIYYMVNQLVEESDLDRLFLALADSSRRRIIAALAEHGDLSVGDASAGVELSPAGITKHVKVLQESGLVSRRLEGRRHVLSLESERLLLAEDWIDRYRTVWSQSISRLADLAAQLDDPQGDQP